VQGPLAGHALRLLGATVTRVEPPGGDPLRGVPPMAGECSARYRALNRGKHVAELDLGTSAGRRELRHLVAGADVFVHNWAPGRAERWELDAPQLAAANPRLVYAWASGWGDALGRRPPIGTDYLVQAYSGLAWSAPSLMTVTDVLGGLVCAQGVVAGLLAAARTGRGQRVDSSLLSAAGILLSPPASPPVRAGSEPTGAVCDDLARLAADPRFAMALEHDGCTFVRSPWRFA
jgi:crotonobetainyl-CoA:carnitine CoA-transferase CaiB-like acyl-CoA transferase